MLAFLALARTLFDLLPIIKQGIEIAETIYPASGSGPLKLDLVKTIIEGSHTAQVSDAVTAPSFTTIWPVVTTIIAKIVDAKNAVPAVDHSFGAIVTQ